MAPGKPYVGEPFVSSGPGDRGAVVVVTSYSFMLIGIAFAILRAWSALNKKKEFGWDDVAFFTANALVVAETAIIGEAVKHGLGRHIETISPSSLETYYKLHYAANLLAIIIQCLAKFSVVTLMERIASQISSKRLVYGVIGLISAWGIFSLFSIAFQCNISQPWVFSNANCTADGRLGYVVIVGNIITDACLSLLFIPVVLKLQIHRSLRILVAALFAVRLLVCAFSIVQLALYPKFLQEEDKTWWGTYPELYYQVVINTSVITAGLPAVQRSLADLKISSQGGGFISERYELSSNGNRKKNSKNSSGNGSRNLSSLGRSEKPALHRTASHVAILSKEPQVHVISKPSQDGSESGDSGRQNTADDEIRMEAPTVSSPISSPALNSPVLSSRQSSYSKPNMHGSFTETSTHAFETRNHDALASHQDKNKVYHSRDFDVRFEYLDGSSQPRP